MNPYLIKEPTCISFSGGRTSAYMLKRILEINSGLPDEAIVCFSNTGKEEEATLKFVQDCSDHWGVVIHWLEYRAENLKFERVRFENASRNGEPFEALIRQRQFLPNPVARFCTVELKVRTIHRYLKSIGWTEWSSYLGIRADEQRRYAKIKNQDYGKHEERFAPLAMDGVTSKIVGDFWASNWFDLELPNHNGKTMHGNCDLCFLKGGSQIVSLINEKPERADWWARMETLVQSSGQATGQGARFRKDRPSYAAMKKFTQDQANLFTDETIGCFCGD